MVTSKPVICVLPTRAAPGTGTGQAEVTASRKHTYGKYVSRDTVYKVLRHLKTLLAAENLFKVEGI